MAVNVGDLEATIRLLDELSPSLRKVEQNVSGFSKKSSALMGLFQGAGIQAFQLVTRAAVSMARDVPLALFKAGSAAEESENLFRVSFGSMAKAARQWSVDLAAATGQNEFDLRKNAATLFVMMESMGVASERAYEMSTALTGLAGDLASFYDLPHEEAFGKIQAGISGEAEPLKRLGILVMESTVKQAALTHGLIKQGEAMDEQTKVQARYLAIMDQTVKAQGDLARTITSPTNAVRALTAQWEALQIHLGQALMPAFRALITLMGSLLSAIMDNKEAILRWVQLGAMTFIHAIKMVIGSVEGFLEATKWIGNRFVDMQGGAEMAAAGMTLVKEAVTNPSNAMDNFKSAMADINARMAEAKDRGNEAMDGYLAMADGAQQSLQSVLDAASAADTASTAFRSVPPPVQDTTAALKLQAKALQEAKAEYDKLRVTITEQVETQKELEDALYRDLGLTREQADAYAKLGPSVYQVSRDFNALGAAVEYMGGLDALSDNQLKALIANYEALGAAGKLTTEQWEKYGAAITEAGGRGLDDIMVTTAEAGFDFAGSLEIAADLSTVLGDNMSNLVGDIAAGATAGLALADNLRKAMDAKDENGDRKGFSGMSTSEKAGAIGSMAGQAAGIWNKNKKNLSGANAAMSGAASGAAAGSAFGPWGTAIGAVGGALIGFFAGKKFRKIAKDAGKVLGVELSQETVEAIEATMEELDLSAAEAALLHIVDAAEDSGRSLEEFGKQLGMLMEGVADESIPAAEGIEQLGLAFSTMREEAETAGRFASKGMESMIAQSRELGVEIPEVTAYVNEQLTSAVEGLEMFVAALEHVSDESLPELGAQAGVVMEGMFQALVAEHGLIGAVDMLGDSFNALKATLTDTLGAEAANEILGPLALIFDTVNNEQLRPLFEGIQGITQAMVGMANAGYLSRDMFLAMQDAAVNLFDQALAGGADLNVALAAIAPDIQAAVEAAARFGIPLSEDMERLKALAEQNGYTFSTDPMDAMLSVLVAIAEVLGADIPAAARAAGDAIGGIPGPSTGPSPHDDPGVRGRPERYQQGFYTPSMPGSGAQDGGTNIRVHEGEEVSVTPAALSGAGGGDQPLQVVVHIGNEKLYDMVTRATKTGQVRVYPDSVKAF